MAEVGPGCLRFCFLHCLSLGFLFFLLACRPVSGFVFLRLGITTFLFFKAWALWEMAAAESSNRTRRVALAAEALRSYGAAADVPVAAFWEELLDAQALGLLGVDVFVVPQRGSVEWYASAESTVMAGWRSSTAAVGEPEYLSSHAARMARLVWSRLLGRPRLRLPEERDVAIVAYERHVQQVLERVPADRLLRWDPQDGWGPLCQALRLDVPQQPFPWRNARSRDFREEFGLQGGQQLPPMAQLIAFLFNLLLPGFLVWVLCCRGGRGGGVEAAADGGDHKKGD